MSASHPLEPEGRATRIVVCYSGGLSEAMDANIECVVGSRPIGGGFGLCEGMRDLEFAASNVEQGEWIAAKLRRWSPRITVTVAPASSTAAQEAK